jgi:uncharacterized PurR-regulated membrane protein YhhQ (DUF165 family)
LTANRAIGKMILSPLFLKGNPSGDFMRKDADTSFNSLNLLSMLSVTTLIFSMLFSYRVIEIGPFICPGGIFAFPFIYFFADIIAEVHGI